jgi:hypothetical protein
MAYTHTLTHACADLRAQFGTSLRHVVWCVVLVGVHAVHLYELTAKQWREASLRFFSFGKVSVGVAVYVHVTASVSSHDGTPTGRLRLLVAKLLQGLCCPAII